MKSYKIIFSVIILIMSTPMFASKYFDGNKVLQMCQSQIQDMSAGCAMFIVGSAESLRMVGYSGKKYCLPKNTSNAQLRKELVGFLEQHQDELSYSAASLFLASLMQNHPCE